MADDEPAIEARRAELRLLRPDGLTAGQLDLYRKIVSGPRSRSVGGPSITHPDGALRGPFNAMLFNPDLGDAVQGLGVAVRYRTSLPGRIRELAILVTAAAADCEYEWHAHSPLARHLGFSEEQLAAVKAGSPAQGLSPEESRAASFVAALVSDGDVPDDELNEFIGHLGTTAAVELIFLVGYYEMLARSLRVWRVRPPLGMRRPDWPYSERPDDRVRRNNDAT